MKNNNEINMSDLVDPGSSSVASCELPTGYMDQGGVLHKTVILKELTGVEEDILASRKMGVTNKLNKILENCVESIGTATPSTENWPSVIRSLVQSDRLFLLIKLRIITLGSAYSFRIECPSCKKFSNPVVNLNDFKITGLKDPLQRTWTGTLPRSGLPYEARVLTGNNEEKQDSDSDIISSIILSRLVSLDGKAPTLAAMKALTSKDRTHLRLEIKDKEGEIDSEVEIGCPHCQHEFKTDIEIGSSDFFFPSVS